MSKKASVPNAWDDDWENLADKSGPQVAQPDPAPKLTKLQRRQQHLDQQRQLWNSAENPDRLLWLEAQGVVPLKQDIKPQVTLLSRKPVGPTVAERDARAGVANLSIGDEEDSEEEDRKKREAELEERQRQAKLDREEKQRRYAEARERIMGSRSSVTRAPNSRDSSHGRDTMKPRQKANGTRSSQPTSSADQSPARLASAITGKQLFDPDDAGKRRPKRETEPTSQDDQPFRQPRGPESSGRGGFGFTGRGG